jgi:hypothetical protein
MRSLLIFFLLAASANADTYITPVSGGSGGGVVNGQVIRDSDGNVFLDAGGYTIIAPYWQINQDGSARFANNSFNISSDGNLDSSGNARLAGGNIQLNLDGSANLASGLLTIYATGALITDDEIKAYRFYTDGAAIESDGSASLAGGNFVIGLDGSVTAAGNAIFDGISLTAGNSDPHIAGKIYQDPDTHALYISQG